MAFFSDKFDQTHGFKFTWLKNTWTADIDGHQVRFVYTPRGKNTPPRLDISLSDNFFAHAVFRKETKADRFAKDIGFNEEVQLFDMTFDSSVYVECEDRDFVSHLLAGTEAKKFLQDILRTMTSLQINGNRCSMTKTPCEELTRVNTDELIATARILVAFAQKIPLPGPGARSATPVTDECRRRIGVFTGVAGALSAAGLGLMIWGLTAFPLLMPGKFFVASLYVAAPVAALAVFFMFHQFKGLSVALRSFAPAAAFSVIGAVLVCWGGGMVLNGVQDVSPKISHRVHVMDKYITRSKDSTSYHLRVDAWDRMFPYYSFKVSRQAYARIRTGDVCTVETKAGLLRFTWVVSHVCEPSG